jgi:hypothetical protein
MERLREHINPEERFGALGKKSPYPTEMHRHALRCQECNELYFVDDGAYQKAIAGLEGDVSEIRFTCEDCENRFIEEE